MGALLGRWHGTATEALGAIRTSLELYKGRCETASLRSVELSQSVEAVRSILFYYYTLLKYYCTTMLLYNRHSGLPSSHIASRRCARYDSIIRLYYYATILLYCYTTILYCQLVQNVLPTAGLKVAPRLCEGTAPSPTPAFLEA